MFVRHSCSVSFEDSFFFPVLLSCLACFVRFILQNIDSFPIILVFSVSQSVTTQFVSLPRVINQDGHYCSRCTDVAYT